MTFRVTVVGGTGVFGRYIVEELLKSSLDFSIQVAGRRPEEFARHFPNPVHTLHFQRLDLNDRSALEKVLAQTDLVILAAGPFQNFSTDLALMAAEKGVHYLDICDDPSYISELLRHRHSFSETHSVLLTGLSSLPGISLPLAELVVPQLETVHDIDIGLFIGNKNQKGRGAVLSALKNLSRPATFIQKGKDQEIPTWSHPENFPYPAPIGAVCSYAFPSPDPLLFPLYYSFNNLTVRVGFEWFLARGSFSVFKKLVEKGHRDWLEKWIRRLFPLFSLAHYIGSEMGCVSVRVTGLKEGKPKKLRASLIGTEKGQKMASLPCVIAAEALARGEIRATGLLDLNRWMAPSTFFEHMEKKGMHVLVEELT